MEGLTGRDARCFSNTETAPFNVTAHTHTRTHTRVRAHTHTATGTKLGKSVPELGPSEIDRSTTSPGDVCFFSSVTARLRARMIGSELPFPRVFGFVCVCVWIYY